MEIRRILILQILFGNLDIIIFIVITPLALLFGIYQSFFGYIILIPIVFIGITYFTQRSREKNIYIIIYKTNRLSPKKALDLVNEYISDSQADILSQQGENKGLNTVAFLQSSPRRNEALSPSNVASQKTTFKSIRGNNIIENNKRTENRIKILMKIKDLLLKETTRKDSWYK